MTKWEFLFGSERVEVEGTTWLDALGKALGAAGLDSSVLTRLHIDVQPGDRVVVREPAGRKMVLQPVPDGAKEELDIDLFTIPPDLETEEIPRSPTGRPLPRRGPPPRATNWRVPTAPSVPTLDEPIPPDPSQADPLSAPVNLERDEPPTEEIDPAALASALAAAHAQDPPAQPVPQKPAVTPAPPAPEPAAAAPPEPAWEPEPEPEPAVEPEPEPEPAAAEPPEPAVAAPAAAPSPPPLPPLPPMPPSTMPSPGLRPGRTRPRRGLGPLPTMAPPMAGPISAPPPARPAPPPAPLEPELAEPPAAVEEPPAAVAAEPPPAFIEQPPTAVEEPPAAPSEPEAALPVPPPPPDVRTVVPAARGYAPQPQEVEAALEPAQREPLDEADVSEMPAPEPDLEAPEPQRAITTFDELEVPAAQAAPPEPPQVEAIPGDAWPEDLAEPGPEEPEPEPQEEPVAAAPPAPLPDLDELRYSDSEVAAEDTMEPLEDALAPLLGKIMRDLDELEHREASPEIEAAEVQAEPPVLAFEGPSADLHEEPAPAEPVLPEPPAMELPPPPPPPPPAEPEPVAEPEPSPPPAAIEPEPPPPAPELPAPPPPPAPDLPLAAKPAAGEDDDALPPGFGDDDEAPVDLGAFMPAKPIKPDDLGEWLFDKSMDINEAMDIPEGARMSLQILIDLVGAESGCVLYGDYNAEALEFIAAAGPTAHKLKGVKVDINDSLAGFCHRMGFGVLVADTTKDDRFDRTVDEHTGYHTEAILAIPIRATDGDTYGCVELLNAPWGFEEWMIDASQNIATTLAGYIQARL